MPTWPLSGRLHVSVNAACDTGKLVNDVVAVCGVAELSVACTVKEVVCAVVGVPDTAPLLESNVRPSGRAPLLRVKL
jgi:hypothetical protein